MSKQNIFDNEKFFNAYVENCRDHSHAENLIEKPALFLLVSDLKGKKVLDLGCGFGEASVECVRLGASQVIGIDISKKMIAVAREKNANDKIEYRNICMEDVALLNGGFDLVISSMAVHFVEDFKLLLEDVYHLLNPGGTFIFSQDHPFRTCNILAGKNGEENYPLPYGKEGKIIADWYGEGVIKYHRTFSGLVNSLVTNGFNIVTVLEPLPDQEVLAMYPQYQEKTDYSDYLIIKAQKAN